MVASSRVEVVGLSVKNRVLIFSFFSFQWSSVRGFYYIGYPIKEELFPPLFPFCLQLINIISSDVPATKSKAKDSILPIIDKVHEMPIFRKLYKVHLSTSSH